MKKLKVYHGKITEMLVHFMLGNKVETDEVTGARTLSTNGVTITLSTEFNVTVYCHKLLMYIISLYTQDKSCNIVEFRLKDFLGVCGKNVNSKPSVDKSRLETKSALETLKHLMVSVDEGERKHHTHIDSMQLIDSKSKIRNGNVTVYITADFAEYLTHRPIGEYVSTLFTCDGRKKNEYALGYKMVIHNSMKCSQKYNTAHTLKVATILENTNLPDYEKVVEERQSWRRVIKDKMENSLANLIEIDVVIEWKYGIEGEIDSWLDFKQNKINFAIISEVTE